MNNFIITIKTFFETLDWKLVIAGFGVMVIFALMVYLLVIIVTALQSRRAAIRVSLPDINNYNNTGSDIAQFEPIKSMAIELINPDDDKVENSDIKENEDSFLTILSIATKEYVPKKFDNVDMPEVRNINYKAIIQGKQELTEKQVEKQAVEHLAYLKEIAITEAVML